MHSLSYEEKTSSGGLKFTKCKIRVKSKMTHEKLKCILLLHWVNDAFLQTIQILKKYRKKIKDWFQKNILTIWLRIELYWELYKLKVFILNCIAIPLFFNDRVLNKVKFCNSYISGITLFKALMIEVETPGNLSQIFDKFTPLISMYFGNNFLHHLTCILDLIE